MNGHDATDELRTDTCGAAASAIAAIPSVRTALFDKQRAFRRAPGLVADGRDMGTVVFADAPYKVFLTAGAEERARRRYKQLKEKGLNVTLSSLLREIEARDDVVPANAAAAEEPDREIQRPAHRLGRPGRDAVGQVEDPRYAVAR